MGQKGGEVDESVGEGGRGGGSAGDLSEVEVLGGGSGADSVDGHGEEGGEEVGVAVPRGRVGVAFRGEGRGWVVVGVGGGGRGLLVGVVVSVGLEDGVFDEGLAGVQVVLDLVEVGFVVVVGGRFGGGPTPLDGSPDVVLTGDVIHVVVFGAVGD